MKRFFYSDGKEKFGPFSFEELKNEKITRDTLIWFEGLTDWTCAKDIIELEEILKLSPPPINNSYTKIITENYPEITEFDNPQNQFGGKSKNKWEIESISNNHPWRRFFARTLDYLTFGYLLLYLFSLLFAYFFPYSVDGYLKIMEEYPYCAGIVIHLLWIPAEAFFLFLFGTTPAKLVFGIRIKDEDGDNLSFCKSLYRAFLVYASGECLGIPFFNIFTRISCYQSLRAQGKMNWEENVGSIVCYKKLSTIRKIINVIVVFLVLVIYTIMNGNL